MHELRRGSEPALINYLSFEGQTGRLLTVSSNKDTVHIFQCQEVSSDSQTTPQPSNTKSYFSALSSLVAYAGSEWSFAQVKVPDHSAEATTKAVCYGTRLFVCSSNACYTAEGVAEGGLLTATLVEDLRKADE